MVRHLHVIVSRRTSDVDVKVLDDCCRGDFDLHGCDSSSETRPGSLSKESHLLTHGLQSGRLLSIKPSLWVEAVWVWEDVGITLLGVGLA